MMLLYTNDTGRVTLIHRRPDLLTRSKRQAATLEVETLPERPDPPDGTSAVLRVQDGQPVWSTEPPPATRHQRDQATQATARLVAQMISDGQLDDATLGEVAAAFAPWRPWEDVAVGDVRLWVDGLVECIQAHTTQPDWTPDVTPALWKVHRTDTGGTVEWEAGITVEAGETVIYEGVEYAVLQGHTTQEGWEPPNTPALFEPV